MTLGSRSRTGSGKCQNWKLSELIGKFQNWKVPEWESSGIGKCHNQKVSELLKIGKCPNSSYASAFIRRALSACRLVALQVSNPRGKRKFFQNLF